MGILGAALGLEVPGGGGVVLRAIPVVDKILGGGQGLLRQTEGVGTHIGDQTHCALAGDVDALVQLLGDGHGAGGGHVQLAGGLLLQGGGGKRGGGLAVLLLPLHPGDGEVALLHCIHYGLGLGSGMQLHLLLPAIELGLKAAQVGGHPGQSGLDGPVLLGLEGPDLLLPLHHQAGGHRLHPSGGQAPADLPPQQRGELIAHDAVQNAPGLLGVDQVLVNGPGGGNGVVDHLFGDLVKGHPIGLVVRDAQQLLQVPGDGLSLPVRVGGQIDAAALFGRLLQVADHVLLALDGLIVGGKAALDVHAQLALGQVPHMAHGCLYFIARSQVFSNGLGLGRGLYDHQVCFIRQFPSPSCPARKMPELS